VNFSSTRLESMALDDSRHTLLSMNALPPLQLLPRRPFVVTTPTVSSKVPDWSRETPSRLWDPPRRLLRSLRRYQYWRRQEHPLAEAICKLSVLEHRFWSVVTGADIPLNCQIGGGLLLVHTSGIVIHPDAKIGPNCLIMQQVTLTGGVRLGGHVDVGAGAKIIRPVTVGSDACIGANAVVTANVPEGATAVGVPARVVRNVDEAQWAPH
jgi:serine O-acetyltransferase